VIDENGVVIDERLNIKPEDSVEEAVKIIS
jgi:hypothetical protein